MGVFDGEIYRVRSRWVREVNGATVETEAVHYADDAGTARTLVESWRAQGVTAVEVSLLTYVSHGCDVAGYGDYWGGGE
ncbi:hypothetical protein ACIF6L_26465 [Kitasatospora sp. NPDC086009]|uniref:hypothetical protein n=1 Tax=unclassified Kitasatospora TaxID=2633591 RepID=UPI0037C6CC90